MSFHLLNAARMISHREPNTPLTKNQLFDMLIDYGAFKDSTILKFAVKNIIYEGFWTKAAQLYNDNNIQQKAISALKHQVKMTFGYPEVIIDTVFDSIWDSDEWDGHWNPFDIGLCLQFEGLPITGTSLSFVDKLIDKGFSWDIYKRCLIGQYNGFSDCEIYCNISNAEVPLFQVDVKLPKSCSEDDAYTLVVQLRGDEMERINSHTGNGYTNSDSQLSSIIMHKDKEGSSIINFTDGIGNGIMIESFLYNPHNNLSTID